MEKDLRYGHVNALFATNRVNQFIDIFQAIPQKVVYTDLDINYNRWLKIIAEPGLLSVRSVVQFAELIGIDRSILMDLVYKEVDKAKAKKPK